MDPDVQEPITLKRKPRSCPACRHRPVATILYGMPAFSEELESDLKHGTVALGGCLPALDGPVWECTGCGLLMKRAPRP